MEWTRVVAVGSGSGYVIAPGLVLTSAHLGSPLTVFRPGSPGVLEGTVVWSGTPGGRDDAALVRVDGFDVEPVRWGRSVTYRPGIPCATWGVPDLVQRPGRPVDVVQLSGTLNPGDRIVGDRYVMNLDHPAGEARWSGMSGAALFCGDLLTGVIAVDPAGRAALEAVPVYVLMLDPEFRALVGEPVVSGIELQDLVDPHAQATGSISTPAGLLPARQAVVPFHGRESLLANLHAWASAPGTGVWIMHGPGGQGKTRLAYEFAAQLTGWEVLWLANGVTPRLTDVVVPLLVVIDYAETRAHQVAQVLGALPRNAKVLMLTRTAGAWLEELGAENNTVRDLLEGARVEPLPVLDATTAGQQDAYRAAVEAFAQALPLVPGMAGTDWTAVTHSLAYQPGDAERTVLTVQISALADLLDHTNPTTQTGPEDRLLAHERRYWRDTATAYGLLPNLSLATLVDAVATVTLLGAPTAADADTLLQRVPGLADQPRDRRDAVRGWLASLYPSSETAFGGLQPDRLAEWLVGRLILDHTRTNVVESLAQTVTHDEAVSLLTVCTRAAAHGVFGDRVGVAVSEWCVRFADTLTIAAIEVATQVEAPAPLVRALDDIVHNTDDVRRLMRLSDAIPEHTLVWATSSVLIAGKVVDRLWGPSENDPVGHCDDLATALNIFAARLSEVGRTEAALAAITMAVDFERMLVTAYSDRYEPSLAQSLNDLGLILSRLGQIQEALAATTESVDIRRRLAAEQPDVFRPYLATSLHNLASQLHAVGRTEEALANLTEAIEINQVAASSPHLARSLNNLATMLGDLGRRQEALVAIANAVRINRELAAAQPDAHLPSLALSLNNLAVQRSEAGQHAEAIAPAAEAIDIYHRLAAGQPDAYQPGLAAACNNFAIDSAALGRHNEAIAATIMLVEIYRRLTEDQPDIYRPDLAKGLSDLATRLAARDPEEALAASTESVTITRELAAEKPADFTFDLGSRLTDQADLLRVVGRTEEGMSVLAESMEIMARQLSELPMEDDDPEVAQILTEFTDLQQQVTSLTDDQDNGTTR